MGVAMNKPSILSGASVLPPMDTPKPKQTEVVGRKTKHRQKGRFQVLNNFADFTLRGLSRSEMAVWLVLYRDSRGGVARTSQGDIAKRSGVSVSTVKRANMRLKGKGLISIAHQGGLNRGVSSYRVHPMAQGSQ